MDRSTLADVTARRMADGPAGLTREDVGRVIDALFGTVEYSGVIAETLRDGEAVTLLAFGGFHTDGEQAVLHPDTALTEFLRGTAG